MLGLDQLLLGELLELKVSLPLAAYQELLVELLAGGCCLQLRHDVTEDGSTGLNLHYFAGVVSLRYALGAIVREIALLGNASLLTDGWG